MFRRAISVDSLWQSIPPSTEVFVPQHYASLPMPARRYLEHAIAPGAPLASAVRLTMHGVIKLNDWCHFSAKQVITREQGMIWEATAWMNGIPIRGWDRLVNGQGGMNWKLLGLFPVMTSSGPDITRSAIGRVQCEYVWLPSQFCCPHIRWRSSDEYHASAHSSLMGQDAAVNLTVAANGQLQRVGLQRWGNPDGGAYQLVNFGGLVEDEATYAGLTIPTQLQVGWYFEEDTQNGGDRFESEGTFFQVKIDEVKYR